MTRRVGLTGGIASGKSTALARFAHHGVPTCDADVVAREVVAPGEPALQDLVAAFGPEVLEPDGSLARRRLGERVFGDAAARARLEAIVHPRVRARMQAWASRQAAPYVVLCVPLLLETGQDRMVDRVLVIDVDPATQARRAMARDGRSEEEVRAVMAAQVDREERLRRADDVLVNAGDRAALERDVDALHTRYLAWAAGAHLPATKE